MKNKRVLVVCDDNVRRKFIERNILDYEFEPLRYPNFLAARKAIQLDSFAVIVIDLLMPIEQKLALVEEACKSQPGTPVIAVEKKTVSGRDGISVIAPVSCQP